MKFILQTVNPETREVVYEMTLTDVAGIQEAKKYLKKVNGPEYTDRAESVYDKKDNLIGVLYTSNIVTGLKTGRTVAGRFIPDLHKIPAGNFQILEAIR